MVRTGAESTADSPPDWPQIVGLSDALLRADPTPVVELNRAAAVAMQTGRRPDSS